MVRKRSPGPTEREAEILAILWDNPGADVETIRQRLKDTPSANTVRTLLGIMVERGLVEDDGKTYGRTYHARVRQDEIQRSALRRLTDTLFAGSAEEVVLRLVDEGEVNAEQLKRIQQKLRKKS